MAGLEVDTTLTDPEASTKTADKPVSYSRQQSPKLRDGFSPEPKIYSQAQVDVMINNALLRRDLDDANKKIDDASKKIAELEADLDAWKNPTFGPARQEFQNPKGPDWNGRTKMLVLHTIVSRLTDGDNPPVQWAVIAKENLIDKNFHAMRVAYDRLLKDIARSRATRKHTFKNFVYSYDQEIAEYVGRGNAVKAAALKNTIERNQGQ